MSFLFINKTLRLNNLKTRTATDAKTSVFILFVLKRSYIYYYISYMTVTLRKLLTSYHKSRRLLLTYNRSYNHVSISIEINLLILDITFIVFLTNDNSLDTDVHLYIHTKLSCQKSILRQMERGVQNGSIVKNFCLLVNTSFFWIFFQFKNLLLKNWFDLPTTEMPMFILFISAEVLYEGAIFPVSTR